MGEGGRPDAAALEAIRRAFFEGSPHAVAIYDSAGTLVEANGRSAAMFGVEDPAELVGYDMFADPALSEDEAAALRRGEPVMHEVTVDPGRYAERHFRSSRTGPIHLLCTMTPFRDEAGAVEGYVVQIVEQTGRVLAERRARELEAQLERTARLELVGRLAGHVAHDLNNLLSGLIGHAQLLQQRVDASLKGGDESVDTIVRAAEDGATLIRKLQGYIRQDTQVHFEPVDLPTLVEDCIALTQPYWLNEPRRTGIRINVTRCFDDVPPVMGSAAELRDVLVNLTLNAVQAMPDGGELGFKTFVNDDGNVCVRVSDTGIGMTDEVKERIFEPLFTTKGDQGTGMGLSASYGIMQEHNGAIQVDSAPGAGTRFTLVFPASTSAPPPESTEPPEPVASDQVRILIVDDEEMVRSVLRQLLSLKGHRVQEAEGGKEALSIVAETPVDIVFTDFGMPEMTGGDLAQQLRAHQPSLPIVLLTGYTDPEASPDIVDAVLHKPFKLEELQSVIRQLVD